MHKILTSLLLASLFIPNDSFAQFSLSSQEMPDAQSSLVYTVSGNIPSMDHDLTGANYTWDYTGLTPASQNVEKYQTATSINFFFVTLGQGAFGTLIADSLGFGQFQAKDIYDVFKTTSARMTAEGRSMSYQGFPIPQFYSDKDEIYQFPLTYLDRDSSTFKVAFSLGGQIEIIQQGYRINEADGWGTLQTPHKTYTNVLRVKSTKVEIDSIKFSGINLPPIPLTTVEYKYFEQGTQGPIMVVAGTPLGGVNQIRYMDVEQSFVGFDTDMFTADPNQTVTLTDTSNIPALQRTWKIDPATYQFTNGTNDRDEIIQVQFNQPGKYDVSLTVTNQFGSQTEWRKEYLEVLDITQVNEHLNDQGWEVYPNPFSNSLIVDGATAPQSLKLMDSSGRTVMEIENSKELTGLSPLSPGTYFLWINNTEVIQLIH